MKFKILVLILSFITYTHSFSQLNDFGIWTGLNIEYKLSKKNSLEINSCIRTFQNTSNIDLFYIEGGISHKLSKNISFSGFYRFISKNENISNYFSRHRLYCDFKYTYPISRVKLNMRLRIQGQVKNYQNDNNDRFPTFTSRLKLSANYNLPSLPVNPFISTEFFHPFNEYDKPYIDETRFSVGIQLKYSKKIRIDIAYVYDNETFPKPERNHIISTELNLEL